MTLLRLRDPGEVARQAADCVAEVLAARPGALVGFPTGRTPLPLYAALLARRPAGVEALRPFALDEYRGLGPASPQSFAAFLRRHVVEPLGLDPASLLSLDGAADDADAECRRYERLVGGGAADLVVLGLGGNGHVAFNEPGSDAGSRTRLLDLTPESIRGAAADFPPGAAVPRQALTIGIATILEARRVLLLVTGAAKAGILRAALEGPETPQVPASFLRRHPDLRVLADAAAVHLTES
jgi:glucosamine-6-phosphate deaminase